MSLSPCLCGAGPPVYPREGGERRADHRPPHTHTHTARHANAHTPMPRLAFLSLVLHSQRTRKEGRGKRQSQRQKSPAQSAPVHGPWWGERRGGARASAIGICRPLLCPAQSLCSSRVRPPVVAKHKQIWPRPSYASPAHANSGVERVRSAPPG